MQAEVDSWMKEHGMFILQSATGYIQVQLNALLFRRLGPMVFQNQPQMFQMLPEPFNTLGKLAAISCPVLVMHGDKENYLRFADGPCPMQSLCTHSHSHWTWE